MSSELQIADINSAWTVYAIIRRINNGKVWQTTNSTFVTYVTANIANYDIALTVQGTNSGFAVADFPSAITAGIYSVAIYRQLGGSPAEGDEYLGGGNIEWNGHNVY